MRPCAHDASLMLAQRLDAVPRGPEKPLQGRIRRVPASRLPRARVSRWTASENARRYDWTASSGSVVANDPINQVDPDGKQSEWTMDRRYIYPHLTEEQREGLEEEHRKIGENAAEGMLTGLTIAIPGGAALRITGAILSRTPQAFQIAARGGQHAGFLRNYAGRSLGEIRSGIRSLGRQIRAHEDKIKDPAKHVTNWDKRSPEYQKGVVDKWKKDIARQKEQRDVLRGLERTRDQCTGTRICR